ncbi:MAG TPA: hypothetical protein VFA18_12180 [Gemmataceae bacterium]|nr:hypothetical protein [Gemmataceae bacterium]
MQTKRTFSLAKNVSKTGAPAGTVLTGIIRSNAGLRIRVFEPQPRGEWGPLRGTFEILDAGDNMHTETLGPLVGQRLDAERLLAIIRRAHPMCVNVVNATILMVEKK